MEEGAIVNGAVSAGRLQRCRSCWCSFDVSCSLVCIFLIHAACACTSLSYVKLTNCGVFQGLFMSQLVERIKISKWRGRKDPLSFLSVSVVKTGRKN